MKILLYSEFFKILGGTEKTGGGLVSALENQKKMLSYLNIPFTENPKDDWDVLQVNIPWPLSLRMIKRAKVLGKKTVMWSHVTVEDLQKSIRLFKIIPGLSWLVKKYLKYAFSLPDMVFCPSQYTKNLLISYGLPADKLFVQSNGVDVKKFYKDETLRNKYRKQFNLEGVVVGNVGLVIYRKGVDTFLRLTKKFGKYQFIWFGKIFSKVLVQRLSTDTPPNMKFTGYVDDMVAGMNALDIFLFPSYEENQGMVILEAAAVGLPILVRDIPVYEGWLVHESNCLKARDEKEFEYYLDKLLGDVNLRKKLSDEAIKLADAESIESQGIHLRHTYDILVK